MKKALVFLLVILIGPILGGLYGVLHDQITFSISEEYYTKFKFIQFGLSNDSWALGKNIGSAQAPEIELRQPRLGVSIVGFLATWWVGLFIGVVLGMVGLIHKTAWRMFRVTMRSLLIVLVTALIIGFCGLLYGSLFLSKEELNWFLPANLIQTDRFIMVGSMHNFSYLGGLIGLIVGSIYSFIKRK